jgi:hypothetical protein
MAYPSRRVTTTTETARRFQGDSHRYTGVHLMSARELDEMSNGPVIEIYRGVEIHYGHNVTESVSYTHFTLPKKGFDPVDLPKNTSVADILRDEKGRERHLTGALQSELLECAKEEIDNHLR